MYEYELKKAVIFDMDGVLIDSEPAYLEMNRKLFKDLGVEMDSDKYHGFVGMSSMKMWTLIKNEFKLLHEVENLIAMERDSMYEILDSAIISEPISGIPELLDDLKRRKIILCVASSSAKENINLVLDKLNLIHYFRLVVSGEEVKRGKPEPDIFLRVAEKTNVASDKCFVIEDSANGIAAANRAKMKCIGYKSPGSSKQDLSGSNLIVENFDETSRSIIINFIEES